MNKQKQRGINTFRKRLKELNLICLEEIGEEFNTNKKYKLTSKDGYLYSFSSMNLCTTIRREGVLGVFFNYNPYTYDNINNYFKLNNLKVELVTESPKTAIENLEFKCLKHNEIFRRNWNSVYGGNINCSVCSGIIKHDINSIRKLVEEKGCTLLTPHFTRIRENYEFQCSCGETFVRRMDLVIHENCVKCHKCMGINVFTYDSVKEDLSNHNIMLLSKTYKNNTKILKVKYQCGFVTERGYSYIKGSNYQCPHCNKKGYKRSTKQFHQEVKELVGDDYTFEGEYTICDRKMPVTHNLCGYKYNVTPHKFINGGHRCPICSISKQEVAISKYLKENNIDFISEHSFKNLIGIGGGLLRFDFAIIKDEEIKFLLEYDGEYHYKPIEGEEQLKTQQNHDKRKDVYCDKNNITLYRIPYWEQDNLNDKIKEILIKEGLING